MPILFWTSVSLPHLRASDYWLGDASGTILRMCPYLRSHSIISSIWGLPVGPQTHCRKSKSVTLPLNLTPADTEIAEAINAWEQEIRAQVSGLHYLDAATIWCRGEDAVTMSLIFRPPMRTNNHIWTDWFLIQFDSQIVRHFKDQARMYAAVIPNRGVAHHYWFYHGIWCLITKTPYAFDIQRERGTRKMVNHATR